MDLTEEELQFLRRHGYGPEDVYDAREWKQSYWMKQIEVEGKWIALGTRCKNGGHRLRSRRGHCVQCDPKKLAFVKRYSARQYVYIAESRSSGLVKIGTCSNCWQREGQLRAERYGGIDDWDFVFSQTTTNAGRVEALAHRLLSQHAVSRRYVKDGVPQTAIELLKCPTEVAKEALTRALNSED
jgi:hypothetical protein